jgi:hypothetical protein
VLLAVPLGAVAKILVQRAVKAYLASDFYNRTLGQLRSEPVTATTSAPPTPVSSASSAPTPLRGETARIVAKGKL